MFIFIFILKLVKALSNSLPKQAFFFTNYVRLNIKIKLKNKKIKKINLKKKLKKVMLLGMTNYPLMELLRIVDFIIYYVKMKILASSLRDFHEVKTN